MLHQTDLLIKANPFLRVSNVNARFSREPFENEFVTTVSEADSSFKMSLRQLSSLVLTSRSSPERMEYSEIVGEMALGPSERTVCFYDRVTTCAALLKTNGKLPARAF